MIVPNTNLFEHGRLDGGVYNPPRRNNSAITETTQAQMKALGFPYSMNWAAGLSEFVRFVPRSEDKASLLGSAFGPKYVASGFIANVTGTAFPYPVMRIEGNGNANVVLTGAAHSKILLDTNTHLYYEYGTMPALGDTHFAAASDLVAMGVGYSSNASTTRVASGFFMCVRDTPFTADDLSLFKRLALENPRETEVVTIGNSSCILFAADSLVAGAWNLKDHHYLATVSALSRWRIEPWGLSGNDNTAVNARIIGNSGAPYSYAPRDIVPSRLVISLFGNDRLKNEISWRYWEADIQRTIQSAKALGAKVTVMNEHVCTEDAHTMQMFSTAERFGASTFDVGSEVAQFDNNEIVGGVGLNPNLWGGVHPGTRANAAYASAVLKWLDTIEAPDSGLKIFRVRPGLTVADDADLIFDSLQERHERFKELTTGHYAITAATEAYFDDLDGASHTFQDYPSEYGLAAAGGAISGSNYLLIEATLNTAKPGAVRLVYDGGPFDVYALNRHAALSFTPIRYRTFVNVTGVPSVAAIYQDGAGVNFTVAGVLGTSVIMSPDTASANAPGTLTKISGTGPATLPYTGTQNGFHPNYYSAYDDVKGAWVQLVGNQIPACDVSKFMQDETVTFLLKKAGAFTISNIEVRHAEGPPKINSLPPTRQRTRGGEWLNETRCGEAAELAAWTLTGGVTGALPVTGDAPPKGCTKVATITSTKYMSQALNVPADRAEGREIEIRIKAQYAKALADSTIKDGYNYAILDVHFGATGAALNYTSRHPLYVRIGWQEVVTRLWLPASNLAGSGSRRVTIKGRDAKPIEVAEVSIKEV